MEFMLSEEQRMLQESVVGFLESECPLQRVRSAADAEQTIADDVNRGLGELGIPGQARVCQDSRDDVGALG